jgi:hypothetical protein
LNDEEKRQIIEALVGDNNSNKVEIKEEVNAENKLEEEIKFKNSKNNNEPVFTVEEDRDIFAKPIESSIINNEIMTDITNSVMMNQISEGISKKNEFSSKESVENHIGNHKEVKQDEIVVNLNDEILINEPVYNGNVEVHKKDHTLEKNKHVDNEKNENKEPTLIQHLSPTILTVTGGLVFLYFLYRKFR